MQISGIHHITAIAGNPQQNVDFYTAVLGLRMVKLTVNFDDPGTYHLYYGNEVGHPGTVLTFFPFRDAPKGRRGTGQATTIAFSIPEGAMGYWIDRFKGHNVPFENPEARFDEEALVFYDPDGLKLELVAYADDDRLPWEGGPVPPEKAILGFYSVALSEEGYERTAALLTETLGFRATQEHGDRYRYEAGAGGPGAVVDVLCHPTEIPGRVAVGTVHHVAWRTPDDDAQAAWRKTIAALGYNVTPVMDRQYFHSIYFREPGGVLFEIATDPPGFTKDETVAELGSGLKLPPWLEPRRDLIAQALPPLRLPGAGGQ